MVRPALYFFFLTGSGATPPVVLPPFREALRTRIMQEVPGLAVYWNRSGVVKSYPMLNISRVDAAPILNTTDSGYDETMLRFTLLAEDNLEAEQLGDAVYDALFPVEGWAPLHFSEGYEFGRLPGARRGPDEQAGIGPSGANVWRYSFDYTFLLGWDRG